MQVKSPKVEAETSPIAKKTIQTIITALDDIRLQSYTMFLASGGWRATERLSLRLSNFETLDIKTCKFTGTPFVSARGKMAKTKKGKRRQLTSEMARQIEKLLAYTYRQRTINRKVDGKWQKIKVKPVPKSDNMMFAPYHSDAEIRVKRKGDSMFNLYMSAAKQFRATTDRLGIEYEDSGKRRKVTLHTFRRFVFTQCDRAVGLEYARYHTGRKTHEYNKRIDEEIAEDFATVEPNLTFLDTTAMEEKQKNIEIELKDIRQRLDKYERYDKEAPEWYKVVGEVGEPSSLSDKRERK
jgi:integrase